VLSELSSLGKMVAAGVAEERRVFDLVQEGAAEEEERELLRLHWESLEVAEAQAE